MKFVLFMKVFDEMACIDFQTEEFNQFLDLNKIIMNSLIFLKFSFVKNQLKWIFCDDSDNILKSFVLNMVD